MDIPQDVTWHGPVIPRFKLPPGCDLPLFAVFLYCSAALGGPLDSWLVLRNGFLLIVGDVIFSAAGGAGVCFFFLGDSWPMLMDGGSMSGPPPLRLSQSESLSWNQDRYPCDLDTERKIPKISQILLISNSMFPKLPFTVQKQMFSQCYAPYTSRTMVQLVLVPHLMQHSSCNL